jgi:capsular exopolysaccharide synthesis family protein
MATATAKTENPGASELRSSSRAAGPALIAPGGAFAPVNEQLQLLRSRVQNWAQDQKGRVILVTSALHSEGRSFIALNLAVALTRAGADVLLVDADFDNPAVARVLGVPAAPGLLNYIGGESDDIRMCQHATRVPRLVVAPPGRKTPGAYEALSSSRMQQFIAEARAQQLARYIIIDSRPALAVPDAQIISSLVDGVLIVVGGSTPRPLVSKVVDTFREDRLLGVVVNRFSPSYSVSRTLKVSA